MSKLQSEYLVFVDESGSHTMGNIDPQYPLFVLAFFIVKKSDYVAHITPAVQHFKFRHFGHDQVILHERDIRKDCGDFSFLKTPALKTAFLDELTDIIAAAPFQLICVVVDKIKLKARYTTPANPYHLGLEFGLERVRGFLQQQGEWEAAVNGSQPRIDPSVHVIVEMRGKNEDDELELEFRRICDGANYKNEKLNFEIVFADKKSNSAGLQLADLVARPIGLSVLRPEQPNRAFDAVKSKLLLRNGRVEGWGLKCFP
ncbi:MAG: DUF3800 domain-containing protein [Gallionella sp.]|nr:DUF3800 domain-containing protein [Gallionella sp.]